MTKNGKISKPQYGVKVNGKMVPLRPLVNNRQSFTVRPYIALTHFIWEVFSREGEAGVWQRLPGLVGKIVYNRHAVLKNMVNGEGRITITKNGESFDARFKVEDGTGIERTWLGRHQRYFIIGQADDDFRHRVVIQVPANGTVNEMVDRGLKVDIGKETIAIVKQ